MTTTPSLNLLPKHSSEVAVLSSKATCRETCVFFWKANFSLQHFGLCFSGLFFHKSRVSKSAFSVRCILSWTGHWSVKEKIPSDSFAFVLQPMGIRMCWSNLFLRWGDRHLLNLHLLFFEPLTFTAFSKNGFRRENSNFRRVFWKQVERRCRSHFKLEAQSW